MRQRLSRIKRRMREKCPRSYKIISKAADIAGWTPIILILYGQILVLTYGYYKSDSNKP